MKRSLSIEAPSRERGGGGAEAVAEERSALRAPSLLPLLSVLVPFALFALAYVWLTPAGMGPDEYSHLAYVHGIASSATLPSATTPEKQQPPLYYLAGAAVYLATRDDTLVRLTSLVFGLATLGVIWLVARRLFPAWRWRAALAAGLVAALPEFQYLSGVVSDDSLAWLAGSLTVLLLVIVIQAPRVSLRIALGAGAVIGVALLSKETVWLPAAVLGVVTGGRLLRERRAAGLGALILVPLLIAGWWFGRNLATFHTLTPPLSPITPHRQYLDSISLLHAWISLTLLSTVGLYGAGVSNTPIRILDLVQLPSLLVGLVALIAAVLVAVWVARSRRTWGGRQRLLAGVLALVAVLVLAQAVVNSMLLDDQPQGRYLLVVAAVPAVAVVRALSAVFRRAGFAARAMLLVAGAAALILGVSGLMTVRALG